MKNKETQILHAFSARLIGRCMKCVCACLIVNFRKRPKKKGHSSDVGKMGRTQIVDAMIEQAVSLQEI